MKVGGEEKKRQNGRVRAVQRQNGERVKGVKARLNKKNRTVDEKEGKDIQQKWMQVKKEGCYI